MGRLSPIVVPLEELDDDLHIGDRALITAD